MAAAEWRGAFILPLPFFERREAMDVPCKQELEFLPNVAGLPILEMFKTNIKITVSYFSFEQYLRPFFVLAHNADILPDSGTGVLPCAAGPDYAQTSIQINSVFSVYYIICEHYCQSRTHT
ncbi:hypothetical protein DSECCO2_223780 [anaerobic digester metagenome]